MVCVPIIVSSFFFWFPLVLNRLVIASTKVRTTRTSDMYISPTFCRSSVCRRKSYPGPGRHIRNICRRAGQGCKGTEKRDGRPLLIIDNARSSSLRSTIQSMSVLYVHVWILISELSENLGVHRGRKERRCYSPQWRSETWY